MKAKPLYTKWRKRLAGETVVAFTEPDELDCGFYRLPFVERAVNAQGQNNGRWKVIGYKPVALFVDEKTGLACQIGDAFVDRDAMNDQWQWFVKHPISEETWRAVAERREAWPDFPPPDAAPRPMIMTLPPEQLPSAQMRASHKMSEYLGMHYGFIGHTDVVPASNRDVMAADNAEPAEPLDVQHATAIDNAIAAAIKKVTSEAEAAQVFGSKNRIAELWLFADKAGKAIYEPIYRTYTAEQKKWSPIVKRAETAEKFFNTAILTFRETERRRIAAEQAEADRKQREIDEANARAADRAIARGEPEPAPAINTDNYPPSPINQQNPIQPTYGTRSIKEEVKVFLDQVTSWDMLFAHFKGNGEIQALLTKLASAEIKAGRAVPGTTTREGLI